MSLTTTTTVVPRDRIQIHFNVIGYNVDFTRSYLTCIVHSMFCLRESQEEFDQGYVKVKLVNVLIRSVA